MTTNCGEKHDDVIKWKHYPRYWPSVRGIHWSPVNSPHKGQWRGALMFSLICAWINAWVNNREAGDLKRSPANYDVIVMGPVCAFLIFHTLRYIFLCFSMYNKGNSNVSNECPRCVLCRVLTACLLYCDQFWTKRGSMSNWHTGMNFVSSRRRPILIRNCRRKEVAILLNETEIWCHPHRKFAKIRVTSCILL